LRAGIGSEQETVHDSTPEAFEDREGFSVYEIDRREDGSLYELGRGAMGVTYRATDTSLQRKAIKEAERAITLPSEKDLVAGPTLEENLASVEVKVGDKNRAIPRLQHLLKIPYADLPYAIASKAPSTMGSVTLWSTFPKTLRGKAAVKAG
jgi:hypothetical protein